MFGWRELLIVLVIVLLIFGTKRIVNMGGDIGKAIQNFRKGMQDSKSEKEEPPARLDPPPSAADGNDITGADVGERRERHER